jgi:hypothetical protein
MPFSWRLHPALDAKRVLQRWDHSSSFAVASAATKQVMVPSLQHTSRGITQPLERQHACSARVCVAVALFLPPASRCLNAHTPPSPTHPSSNHALPTQVCRGGDPQPPHAAPPTRHRVQVRGCAVCAQGCCAASRVFRARVAGRLQSSCGLLACCSHHCIALPALTSLRQSHHITSHVTSHVTSHSTGRCSSRASTSASPWSLRQGAPSSRE